MTASLSGYLLASPNDAAIPRAALETASRSPSRKPFLRYEGQYQNLKLWEHYTFFSDRSFSDDNTTNQHPPFKYPVYCARSGTKLIILSERRRLTDYIIETTLNSSIFPNLRHVNFHLEKIIAAFQDSASQYRLTSLHGRYSGPRRSLRTIALYGPEVTDSALFKDQHHLFDFYLCGIAERQAEDPFLLNDDGEVARMGNNGSITIQSFTKKRATELTRIVSRLIKNKWVDDWVLPWEELTHDTDEGS